MMKSPVKHLISALLFTLLCYGNIVQAETCLVSTDEHNITLCTTLANQGDAKAQNTLGEIYYQNALVHQGYHTKARILFEQAAAQGLAQAQYNLGAMYRDEFNNFPVALGWFEKAAEQGNLDAMNSIGYIYENGSGGEPPRLYIFDENGKNTDPNIPQYEAQFADYDNSFSMPSLPYRRSLFPMAEFGQGVAQNYALAAQWYQQAADQGHALAQTNLAYLYLMGFGVEKDENIAFELYQKAAKQDFVPALNTLAFLYIQGLGTQEDVTQGYHTLVKSYQLQPNHIIERSILRLQRTDAYLHLQLHADLAELPEKTYQNNLIFADFTSDEDELFERLHFMILFYRLNIPGSGAAAFSMFYSPRRPTAAAVLDIRTGERSELKELYLLKNALQSNFTAMRNLSYYYKGEVKDIEKAQLWRKYAIKMGEFDLPNYWPRYDNP